MDNLNLLIDLHIAAERQGPGGEAETRRAIELSGLSKRRSLKVADIGCGTGASTLVLARELDAQIIAVDSLSEFLEVLRSRAARAGLADRISTVNASMDTLPFEAGSLDAIWSEGAIYNMGFESGVRQWRRFLKRGRTSCYPNTAGWTATTVRCSSVFPPSSRGMNRATRPRPWWPRRNWRSLSTSGIGPSSAMGTTSPKRPRAPLEARSAWPAAPAVA